MRPPPFFETCSCAFWLTACVLLSTSPSTGEFAIECKQAPAKQLNTIIPTVHCHCGQTFCFGCTEPVDHRPVICKIAKLWRKKCGDDSETSNWISANTKECTKCQSTIEKNGGCK